MKKIKNICGEEIDLIRESIERKIEEVRNAFDDMSQKYNNVKILLKMQPNCKIGNWMKHKRKKKKDYVKNMKIQLIYGKKHLTI